VTEVGEDLALVDGDPSRDTTTGILVEWVETG
jgi:hypothetical protein